MQAALRSCQLKRAFSRISGLLHNTLQDIVIEMKCMLCTAASICATDRLQSKFQLRLLHCELLLNWEVPLRNKLAKSDLQSITILYQHAKIYYLVPSSPDLDPSLPNYLCYSHIKIAATLYFQELNTVLGTSLIFSQNNPQNNLSRYRHKQKVFPTEFMHCLSFNKPVSEVK